MLEMHRRLSDIILTATRRNHGGILSATSPFRHPRLNVNERKINSFAAIAERAARSTSFDFDCGTA
jgi:hypothetical protein